MTTRYAKQTWVNKPDLSTPLGASRMNHVEAGIWNAVPDYPETTRTLSHSNGGQGGQSVAFVGLAATTIASVTAIGFRFPFRLPANVDSFSIKIRNYNSNTQANGTNPLTLVKACMGRATSPSAGALGPTGNFQGNTATTLATSGTIPNTSSYLTLGPFTSDLPQDGADWLLAISATCTSQTLSTGIGQCWRWGNSTSATDPTVAASGATVPASWIPLDIVIEYTCTNRKKALMVLGDSIPEGTQGPSWALNGSAVNAAPTPLYMRFWDRWAAERGDWMVQNHSLYGQFASSLASSSNTAYVRQATANAHFDAAVIAIGCNDMASAVALSTLQGYWQSCLANLQGIVGTSVPIYAVNYTPYSGATTTKEQVRKQMNQWFSQYPGGIAGVIDASSVMSVPSGSATAQTTALMDTNLTCDMVHPSYQGTDAMIRAINAVIP